MSDSAHRDALSVRAAPATRRAPARIWVALVVLVWIGATVAVLWQARTATPAGTVCRSPVR